MYTNTTKDQLTKIRHNLITLVARLSKEETVVRDHVHNTLCMFD